jgi:hypothetical protein
LFDRSISVNARLAKYLKLYFCAAPSNQSASQLR